LITSATIDPQRFAAHFGDDTPIVEVSGRKYPVETRYRPLADDDEQVAHCRRRDGWLRKKSGDVPVFLKRRARIRDAADMLAGRLRGDVELLPLTRACRARAASASSSHIRTAGSCWRPTSPRRR